MINKQLPLGVQLRDDARFDDFQPGANAELLSRLQALSNGESGQLYMHGGTGKSHLLQAACKQAIAKGHATAYLPLQDLAGMGPGVLDGMAGRELLCVDDVQAVSTEKDWAPALMRLCDIARTEGHSLVMASACAPSELKVAMPDLATRLGWGMVYSLKPLSDDDKLEALRLRARTRGLELPSDVGRYLLTRGARDLPALMDTLSQLDVASLAAKRRLTIPFVKGVMDI